MIDSDEHLVRRARSGDREAFSRLVERYERAALALAGSILHCWHDARDAVQDAFVTAYQRLNRLWSPSKFGAWLLKIVRRQSLWLLRRRRTRSHHLVPIGAEPEEKKGRQPPIAADAMALIARLPEQECVVISLRHLDDLPVAVIAQITGRPVGTVTKQLSRGYARMRLWLEQEN